MDPLLTAALVGLVVGVVVGALGAGGGILSVPILVYVLGQSAHSAAASSLVIVGATALAGLIHHIKRRTVDWGEGIAFGLLGIVGSVVGSRLSVRVDADLLLGLFAGLLGLVSIAMFVKALASRRAEQRVDLVAPVTAASAVPPPRGVTAWLKIIALASVTGVLTGFFGVGGGFVVVPVLVLVLGLSMRYAAGTSLVVMVIASASGLLARLGSHVVIDWPLVATFTVTSMVGGLLGGPAAARAKAWLLTLIFALLLAGVAGYVASQLWM